MKKIRGIATSGGVAVGPLFLAEEKPDQIPLRAGKSAGEELRRVNQAREQAEEQLSALSAQTMERVGRECSMIFQIHIMMLEDDDYYDAICRIIQKQGACAEYAVWKAGKQFAAMFAGMEDEYMRARMADVEDIGKRMLHLLNPALGAMPRGPEKRAVVAAPFVTPSQVLAMDRSTVIAVLTQGGSRSSHSAILARALGIPAVTAIGVEYSQLKNEAAVIVDGFTGDVVIDPDEKTLSLYRGKKQLQSSREELEKLRGKPAQTLGGRRLHIYANIWKQSDLPIVLASDAEGIGLFRTESLYRDRTSLPGEEEQFAVYRSILEKMKGRPVTLRTASLGSHRQISCLAFAEEDNPAMGLRGIRYSLEHPDILETQLRAALRAALYGKLGLLLPMVTSEEEVRQARACLREAARALQAEGTPCRESVPLGVMIETPASAVIAGDLAKVADFFSIGTNTLTQYTLAADRSNPSLSTLYDFRHPAVLQLVREAVFAAKNAGIPVSVCGDAAADPLMLDFYLNLGVNALSVAPSSVLELRRVVREMH